VGGVQLSDTVYFLQVEGSHLDHHVQLLVLVFSVCVWVLASEAAVTWLLELRGISHTDLSVEVHFTVDSSRNKIKQWNNITREIL